MKNRRKFLKQSSLTGLGVLGNGFFTSSSNLFSKSKVNIKMKKYNSPLKEQSIIGAYGTWAAGLIEKKLPSLSFRNKEFTNVESWQKMARKRLIERLGIPEIGGMPKVTINKSYAYDGLWIEEITWQLPYGRSTEAIVLKPQHAKSPLPGILAFHDHGGNKYFGIRKITKTSDIQHPLMVAHQKEYYEGKAWANEIARKGYVVMVSDAFSFASRRVMMNDLPEEMRNGLSDANPEDPENIEAYNHWAGQHEHVMAKSLFSAGTTWPGVFFAEDQKALDILCARKDVDASRVGCAGLSGGGLRTVFMGGLDQRIKCAICLGFMTTWQDFILNKSFTHTWMTYVPLLPNELDFPEILSIRAPLPTMVLNDSEDSLYTLPQMQRANLILQEVFHKAGADDKYACSFHPGPHKFDQKMQAEAFDWFDKWLSKK